VFKRNRDICKASLWKGWGLYEQVSRRTLVRASMGISQVQHNPRPRSVCIRRCCDAPEPKATLNTWLKWKGVRAATRDKKRAAVEISLFHLLASSYTVRHQCHMATASQWLRGRAGCSAGSTPTTPLLLIFLGPRIVSSSLLLHPKQPCLPPTRGIERRPPDSSQWWRRQDSSKALRYDRNGGHKYQDKQNSSPWA